jgi:hypothetical protein
VPRVRLKTTQPELLALFGYLMWASTVALAALGASACSEVESCKESVELGCINTAPRQDSTKPCLFDLVLRGDRCVKPGSDEDLCGLCAEGSLCVPERNTCLNFCEPPAVVPGSGTAPEPIFCEAIDDDNDPNTNPMLSFEEVCTRRCRLQCQRQAQFCPGFECAPGACDRPEVQAACLATCPPPAVGGNDLACLTRECNDVRFARCDSMVTCPNNVAPDCANLTCTNDCMFEGEGLGGDGYCDDGDVVTSTSALCNWGTDCADCGPRRGTAPEPGLLGSLCQYSHNCDGGTESPNDATAWCLELVGVAGSQRCVPDCSRGQGCPESFECVQVMAFDEVSQMEQPIIEGGRTASACRPTQCQ